MNPNSQNQLWSLWTFTVTPGDKRKNPPLEEVKGNCWHFARQPAIFGSTGQMHVQRSPNLDKDGKTTGFFWTVKVRVEGAEVRDARYRELMIASWAKFFSKGFGPGTHTHCDTKLEAGSRQDGTPPDQLIILPPLRVRDEDEGSHV